MPISIADLRAAVRCLEVETVSGTVEITYRVGAVTQEAMESVVLGADGKPVSGFDEIIAHLVGWLERWDVLDGEAMYPISAENLRVLPRAFLLDIYGAIHSDVRVRPTRRAGSLAAS